MNWYPTVVNRAGVVLAMSMLFGNVAGGAIISVADTNGDVTGATSGTTNSLLAEWGVNVKTNSDLNQYVWLGAPAVPNTSAITGSYTYAGLGVNFWLEDTNNGSNPGPGSGGQDYDAEYLGLTKEAGSIVSMAMVSGQRPNNGYAGGNLLRGLFSPGDIMIKMVGGRVFGIEVGGGPIDTLGTSSIFEGATGTTYSIDGSGYTNGVTIESTRLAGSIWETGNTTTDDYRNYWIDGISFGGVAQKVQMKSGAAGSSSGAAVAQADYVFTRNAIPGQHSLIELSFDASFMAGDRIAEVSWAPSCGNDYAMVVAPPEFHIVSTPEPATCLIWVGLGATIAGVQWRRGKQRG